MTITTRMIAKGIPLRLPDPKPKGKPHTKQSNTKIVMTQGSRKRGLYCPPQIPPGFLRIPEDSCTIPGLSIG